MSKRAGFSYGDRRKCGETHMPVDATNEKEQNNKNIDKIFEPKAVLTAKRV